MAFSKAAADYGLARSSLGFASVLNTRSSVSGIRLFGSFWAHRRIALPHSGDSRKMPHAETVPARRSARVARPIGTLCARTEFMGHAARQYRLRAMLPCIVSASKKHLRIQAHVRCVSLRVCRGRLEEDAHGTVPGERQGQGGRKGSCRHWPPRQLPGANGKSAEAIDVDEVMRKYERSRTRASGRAFPRSWSRPAWWRFRCTACS